MPINQENAPLLYPFQRSIETCSFLRNGTVIWDVTQCSPRRRHVNLFSFSLFSFSLFSDFVFRNLVTKNLFRKIIAYQAKQRERERKKS